jgi:hypothetical protein
MTIGTVRNRKITGSCTTEDRAICDQIETRVRASLTDADREAISTDIRCKRNAVSRVFNVILVGTATKSAICQLVIGAPDGVLTGNILDAVDQWMADGHPDTAIRTLKPEPVTIPVETPDTLSDQAGPPEPEPELAAPKQAPMKKRRRDRT